MWLARNKKFEKLGVNENYVNQEAVTSDAEYNNKKKSFFAFLQKLDKTENDEKINIDTSEQENEKAHGEKFTYTGTELYGRCLCHENDHLDGILYIDNALEMLDPEDIEEA